MIEGEIEYSAYISYDVLETATYEKGEPIIFHDRFEGTVKETAWISCVTMIRITDANQKIEEVRSVTLDQHDFTIGEGRFE